LNGMDLPSLSKIGRFSIFLSVAWVGRSLFVFTSPSNSTVLSMASRFSSECLEGIVSFASFAFVFTAIFSCGTASRAEAEGGPEEMAMIAVAQCSYRPGSRSSDSCKAAFPMLVSTRSVRLSLSRMLSCPAVQYPNNVIGFEVKITWANRLHARQRRYKERLAGSVPWCPGAHTRRVSAPYSCFRMAVPVTGCRSDQRFLVSGVVQQRQ
jgi:hypothetical protein